MTDLNLAELARLEREATEEPWVFQEGESNFSPPPEDCLGSVTADDWIIAEIKNDASRPESDAALITAARNQLRPLLNLVDGLALRLEEAKNQKVVLNGMTQEQKAAIFAIKAIVVDALMHYQEAKGGE